MMGNWKWFGLLIVIMTALSVSVACDSGGDGNGVPIEDGDSDIEYAEWEEGALDGDVGDGDTSTDGDGIDGDMEWDRISPDERPYDTMADVPFRQMRRQFYGVGATEVVPRDVRAIIPRVSGGAYFGAQNGLFWYNPGTEAFEKINNPEGINDFRIEDMVMGYDNTLYMIAYTDQTGGVIDYLYSMRYSNVIRAESGCVLNNSPISVTTRGASQTLFIGTNAGIFEFNNTECVRKPPDYPGGWITDLVGSDSNRLAVIKQGAGGPDELHMLDGSWTTFLPEDGLLDANLSSVTLYEDEGAGRLEIWVTSDSGLQKFNIKRRTFSDFLPVACAGGSGGCGLPVADVRRLVIAPDNSIWGATAQGIISYNPDAGDERWHLYGSRRWLKEDSVSAVGYDNEGNIWVGHPDGVTRLYMEEWTLKDKADYYVQILRDRHLRLGGFVGLTELPQPGDGEACSGGGCPVSIEMNASLLTGMYALAETFRSVAAVPVDEQAEARDNAWQATQMVLDLERATQIDGLPAGALMPRGDAPIDDPDGPEWQRSDSYDWLGNSGWQTLPGHAVLYAFYNDIATNGGQKDQVSTVAGKLGEHLVDYGYRLIDVDGEPTDEGDLTTQTVLEDEDGYGPLRALTVLTVLRVAYDLSGDETIWNAYIDRAYTAGYAERTREQKAARGVDYPSDLLAFLNYAALMRHADVVDFHSVYKDSLKRAWEAQSQDHSALNNIIYGATAHTEFGLAEAVTALREMPVDLADWRIDTCERGDVSSGQPDPVSGLDTIASLLPADERKVIGPGGNPYECAWSTADDPDPLGGNIEYDGVSFLLPYWMARYYGMIGAPSGK